MRAEKSGDDRACSQASNCGSRRSARPPGRGVRHSRASENSCRGARAGVLPNLEATTMAILPADEDYARAVLTIFRGSRVQAKQSLKSSHVKAEFLSHNLGRAPDYDAAVEYALEQGWVTLQLGAIRLTEVGFAEL